MEEKGKKLKDNREDPNTNKDRYNAGKRDLDKHFINTKFPLLTSTKLALI